MMVLRCAAAGMFRNAARHSVTAPTRCSQMKGARQKRPTCKPTLTCSSKASSLKGMPAPLSSWRMRVRLAGLASSASNTPRSFSVHVCRGRQQTYNTHERAHTSRQRSQDCTTSLRADSDNSHRDCGVLPRAVQQRKAHMHTEVCLPARPLRPAHLGQLHCCQRRLLAPALLLLPAGSLDCLAVTDQRPAASAAHARTCKKCVVKQQHARRSRAVSTNIWQSASLPSCSCCHR
jgi:hypothetical protein